MVITSSLANGLASRTFQQVMTEMVAVFILVKQITNRQGLPSTPKGARKLLSKLKPLYEQVSLIVREDETKAYGPYLSWLWFEPAGTDGSISLSKIVDAPLSRYREIEPVVRFTKHAVSRGHQRLDAILWSDVQRDFLSSSLFAWLFYRAKERLPIMQAFLPTPNGVFAGEFDADGRLNMLTYIGIENASSRWQMAYGVATELEEIFPEYANQVLDAVVLMRKPKLDNIIEWITQRLSAPEFHWLQDVYEARPDPVGEAWLSLSGNKS